MLLYCIPVPYKYNSHRIIACPLCLQIVITTNLTVRIQAHYVKYTVTGYQGLYLQGNIHIDYIRGKCILILACMHVSYASIEKLFLSLLLFHHNSAYMC